MSKYECDCCGACCQGHTIVEADDLDLLREPRLAEGKHGEWTRGLSAEEISRSVHEEGRCLLIAAGPNRPCPFLGADKLCTIYPTRPNVCVYMQAGDDLCQHARREVGLPPLLPIAEQ